MMIFWLELTKITIILVNKLNTKNVEEVDDSIESGPTRPPEETDSLIVDTTNSTSYEDPEELERRRLAYSQLKKDDKIFNNSYNMGTATDEDSEHRSHSEIKIDPGSAHSHLYDKDRHSDYVDDSITSFDINEFIKSSSEIQAILGDNPEKKKFTKPEINELFNKIRIGVTYGKDSSAFVNTIHVLDSISSLAALEYKKIFDMLTYENKALLLVELDKKYNFLDRAPKNFKIF